MPDKVQLEWVGNYHKADIRSGRVDDTGFFFGQPRPTLVGTRVFEFSHKGYIGLYRRKGDHHMPKINPLIAPYSLWLPTKDILVEMAEARSQRNMRPPFWQRFLAKSRPAPAQ